MKRKKFLALFASAVLCVSMLAGCGGDTPSEANTQPSEESSVAQESSGSEEVSEAHSTDPGGSVDPLEMIHEGYYSWTYPVDGMDDMCAFFHFYEEQPVLGAVFYAGFAWNQITYAGTYTVEEKDCSYSVCLTREDQTADPAVYTEGTAPYTVTFYDFAGNELGSCAYDGEYLYNDSAVDGTGGGAARYAHDVDAASPSMKTYESELGIAYLDFVAEETATSTLTLYHNGRYMDMVDMMVEGTWSMAESADGYDYTLTPDSASDTGAVVAVSADQSTAVYTAEGGEGVAMINTANSGPKAAMEMNGTTPIPGQEVEADVIGKLYTDGSVTVVASAFGSEFPLDEGTWTMGENGYTVTFQFKNAGELVSELGEAGAFLHYVVASEVLGDVDTELVISIASDAAAAPAYLLKGEIPVTEEAMGEVSGTLYDDGTVVLSVSAFGQSLDLDAGTYTEENFTFTVQFDNAGELVSGFGEAGAVLQYVGTSEVLGDIDTELVISLPE
ncbi:MAG: hypothetical protein K2L18_00525 [Acetatifactor sp.]|nr:hypothetical protein [Acetatifactor sp.]